MPSIISTSIKLTDRHNGPYALRRSANFVFLLLARQNKQVSFALARASVRRFSQYYHTRQDDGSLSIGDNLGGWCSKKTRMRNAVALSQLISLVH